MMQQMMNQQDPTAGNFTEKSPKQMIPQNMNPNPMM